MAHVFISYSHAHTDLTRDLAALLVAEGYTVWWDHALESWQSFQEAIDREIAAASVVVVIWSPGAAGSLYVKAEANKAIAARKLVNVRAPGFPHSAIPSPYNAMHIDEPDLDEPHRLLRSIRSVWSGKPYSITEKPLHEHYRETFSVSLFDPKREGWPADPGRLAPSELLQARWEIVPYMDAALGLAAEMEAWCENSLPATAGRLVQGAGGFGKTRLMIEVAKRLRAKDWLAGFVQPVAVAGDLQEARQRRQAYEQLFAFGDEPGVLLAFDYAEGRQDEVAEVVKLLEKRETGRPVRLVLLSRGDGWWEVFHDQRAGARAVFRAEGRRLGDVRRVADLPQGQPRLDLFVETVAAFEPVMAKMAEAGRFPGYDPHRMPQPVLTERLIAMRTHEDYARPLAIQMEALLYLASASPAPGQTSTADLLREVLALEEMHWAKLLGDEPKPLAKDPDRRDALARGVSQITAVQGVTGADPLTRLLMADGFYSTRKAPGDVAGVRRDVTHIYARGGEAIAHLEPDLVGEHLVAGTADTHLIDGCLAWIAALPEEQRSLKRDELLTVLVRATRREHGKERIGKATALIDHVIAAHRGLIDALTYVAASTPGQWLAQLDGKALDALESALPQQSVARIELALAVCEQQVERARAHLAAASDGDVDKPLKIQRLSTALNNLGVRLAAAGRREAALQAAQEAVDIRRALARDRPDAFLPNLASSLNNLGIRLSDLGRREAALQAAQEAVDIYRALARDRPDAFLPNLASSLNNLGIRLSDLGRREAALQAAQEAVDIYRALARDRPDAFLPNLATSLGAISQSLAAAGRHDEASEAAREGLAVIAPFVEAQPQAFGDLARGLGRSHLEHCQNGGREPDTELLARVARALGGGEGVADEDDPALAALKARISAIVEAAQRTGTLDETALAELPAELAQQLRAAWAAQTRGEP